MHKPQFKPIRTQAPNRPRNLYQDLMYIIPEFNHHSNNVKIETYNGRIKTLKDALLVLEGARLGYLPKIKRRLNGLEREFIAPNTVFAWNETECGMKRWTDGKNWSASKVLGPFLIYKELDSDKTTVKKNGLIKQSFSLTTKQHEKLHLIGYYKEDENDNEVPVPTDDAMLKDLKLNGNIYQEYLLYYDQYLNYDDAPQSIYPTYTPYYPVYPPRTQQGYMAPTSAPAAVPVPTPGHGHGPGPHMPTSAPGSVPVPMAGNEAYQYPPPGMVFPQQYRQSYYQYPMVPGYYYPPNLSSAPASATQPGTAASTPVSQPQSAPSSGPSSFSGPANTSPASPPQPPPHVYTYAPPTNVVAPRTTNIPTSLPTLSPISVPQGQPATSPGNISPGSTPMTSSIQLPSIPRLRTTHEPQPYLGNPAPPPLSTNLGGMGANSPPNRNDDNETLKILDKRFSRK